MPAQGWASVTGVFTNWLLVPIYHARLDTGFGNADACSWAQRLVLIFGMRSG